eukprot:8958383-Pyramimonas_sp.AAC.1
MREVKPPAECQAQDLHQRIHCVRAEGPFARVVPLSDGRVFDARGVGAWEMVVRGIVHRRARSGGG